MVNGGSVADQERVEVKRQQTAHALAQPRRIIHHFFAQKAKPPWGITDYGISHYEQLPLRPVESHFARGFSRHTYPRPTRRSSRSPAVRRQVPLPGFARRQHRRDGLPFGPRYSPVPGWP